MAKIAVLIEDYFEDIEYLEPADALREEGHELIHISTSEGPVNGKEGTEVEIDVPIEMASVEDYDALFIPGGFSPDILRADENAVNFVADFMDSRKNVFAICHGPQLLMAADRVGGRVLTAWKTVQKDLMNTDANVLDQEVVEDNNLITSRGPDDISAFIEVMKRRL